MEVVALEVTPRGAPLYKNGNFLLLWFGQFVSQMGDRLAIVAFPWLIYHTTGSVVGTGVVFALSTAPYVLFGALAGVAIDRFNRRLLMVGADLVRAGLVLAVPFVATRSTAAVYVLAFLIATAAVVFDPAKLALLPDIVADQRLLRANSLLATGENITEIVGYAAAGVMLAYVATTDAFRIDSATFVVSAVALIAMRYAAPAAQAAEKAASSVRGEVREGLAYLRGHRGLLMNTVMVCASVAGMGATFPLSFMLAVRVLDGGTQAFGLFGAATGIGYLVGSLALATLATSVRKGWAMIIGITLMGASLAGVALCHTVWQACIPFAVFGLANAVALIAVDTYLQQAVPEALRGRVFGVRFTLTQGTYALSVLAAGALAAFVAVPVLFVIAGVIVAVPALIGLTVRDIREA
jgi:MFS transporter, DHA3 family, macrolide efflux protein